MTSIPVTTSSCLRHIALFWTLLLAFAPAFGDDRLSASVDRDQVAVNETFELTVEWHDAAHSQPDFSALEHQFEVLGIRQTSQTNMGGASISTVSRWHLTLLPKDIGTLIIPSFHFEGAISEALSIDVKEADPTARAEQRYWLESSVDREQAHIGEQILVTYRLYYAHPLRQMSRSDLAADSAEVLPLQERQFQTVIDGVHFQVAELRFALFASRSGTLDIAPLQLDGYSGDSAGSRFGGLIRGLGDPVRLRSDRHQVEILPRPAAAGSSSWLPARGVSLSEQWSHQDQPLRVGEPVTRTVRIDAQGVKAQQLPELDFGEQDGFRIYPEQPKLQHREDENGLLASRIETHALIASRPGPLTLPPVRVQWWDTEADRMRETVLAGRTLEVLPGADAPTSAAPPQAETPAGVAPDDSESQRSVPFIWLGLSLLLNVVLLVLLLMGAYRGRHLLHRNSGRHDTDSTPSPRPERRQLERRLQQLSQSGDGRAFRSALLEWTEWQWPDHPATLDSLARLAQRPRLTEHLRALDQALYDHGTEPSPQLKAEILEELKTVPAQTNGDKTRDPLPPLYS